MDQYQRSHEKKVGSGTGGRKNKARDKKLAHMGNPFISPRVRDVEETVCMRERGGNRKFKVKKALFINVIMKDKKAKKVKIISVVESHNPEFVRQNVVTKGAVVNTELGKARVMNRIGQDGLINGVLL
ncbi:MAG: 30S ribosomal protein S8e [Candidatus Micrarchaeota archaeon]